MMILFCIKNSLHQHNADEWILPESNRVHVALQATALPIELKIHNMGWTNGLEPSPSGATIQRSRQLNYAQHKAHPLGLEPKTL